MSKNTGKKFKNPLFDYENKWVALNESQNKVIASSGDLKKLHEKIKKIGAKKQIVLTWVPPFDVSLAP